MVLVRNQGTTRCWAKVSNGLARLTIRRHSFIASMPLEFMLPRYLDPWELARPDGNFLIDTSAEARVTV